MKLWKELRRRRVFRVMGLYIVGAWLVLQVAATFFPAWGIPDEGLRYLIVAAVIGFPIAIVFGWFFDVTPEGIRRTPTSDAALDSNYSLKRTDYLILAALAAVAIVVVYGSFERVVETTSEELAGQQKAPNSVAVIPFVNLDEETDSDYFSDGITEEILHRLSQFTEIHVLGQASSFAFKASDMQPARISDLLGVSYLLLGSVRRDAGTVRVRASLVDDSGKQVWSTSFNREMQGIFAVQSEIANRVARQMVAQIAPRETEVATTTRSAEAYDQYLIGREFLRSRVPNFTTGAGEAFAQAIELDNEFAPAHAGLAMTIAMNSSSRMGEFADEIDRAQSHADIALRLAPGLADGHAAQGLILLYGQEADFVAAEEALRRAIELDPTLINAYNWLSIALNSQGRRAESEEVAEQALERDPLNPIISANAATNLSGAGDFYGAERKLLRLMDLPRPPGTAMVSLYGLYVEYGRYPKAIDWAQTRIIEYGEQKSSWPYSELGNIYLQLGLDEDADYWIDKAIERDPHPLNNFFRQSFRLKVHGRFDEMGANLVRMLDENSIDVSRLPVFAAEIIGAIHLLTERYETGFELLEGAVRPDELPSVVSGGSRDKVDFMQMLVHAYRQVGRDEDADAMLETCGRYLDFLQEERNAAHPGFLETLTLHHAMRGDMQSAVRTFEQAVDTGWRNLRFIEHDPRWQPFFELPAVQSQLAFVRADLERQRVAVTASDAERDFRALVESRTPAE